MADHDWRAGDGVVVRTPLLPASTLVEWGADPDPRRYLAGVLDLPEVDEAIFVASPSLYEAIATWRAAPESAAGQRAERAIVKYVGRMAARATPFGLFSGVSVGTLGRETHVELAPRSEYRRRTRLDNDYLFVLVSALEQDPAIRERLVYRPNTSIYRIAGRLRYARALLVGKERRYDLVLVEVTPFLDDTLARAAGGARLADLARALVVDDITLDEATAYINELVDAQLLVPDLGVHVTGPEPIDGTIAQLDAAGITGPAEILRDARARIAACDAAGVGNSPDRYRAIASALDALPAKVDLSRLFQVDMIKPGKITLGARIAADLAGAIAALAPVVGRRGESMADFRRAFRERYEDREVPLAEALDEESGIGFEVSRHPGSEGAPLLADLAPPGSPPEERVRPRAMDRVLMRKLADALAAGAIEIALTDADLAAMKADEPARLPDAFSTMARLAASPDELARGEVDVLFEGASGPSGAKLLGRFCHASPELEQIVRRHHALEEAHRPDAIFAEIVHLNEGRIGNILCRPVLRAHEIVYLGVSGAPHDARIQLDDLRVSVVEDRVVLRSQRLGKEVIPRLTTAHNFRLRSLGVYRFLCALASQGRDTVGFSWGSLDNAPFLPRVRLGRVWLSRATWNLDARDLDPITAAEKAGPAKAAAAVAALRAARRLPRYLAIAASDNELPIDLDNPLLAAAFADELSGQKWVKVVEMFPTFDRLVSRGPEGRFVDEIVVTFARQAKPAPAPPPPIAPTLRRTFVPGSEWLYAKLYCGESTADRVLRDAVAPVVRAYGGPWFFLRYGDPDHHVRVRLHGDPARLLGEALPALERAVTPLQEAGVVHKLVLDTYARELERYGGDRGIELVEQIFWRDSEAVLGIVELLDGDAGAEARWKLALRGIDALLDAIGLAPDERARVVTNGRDMLGREMRCDADYWKRVGARFTKERADLELLFARDAARDADHDLEPGFALLATRDAALRELAPELRRRDDAGELAPRLGAFAWSLVHMHANRLLHASQRAQEMILYDFLRRLHAQRKARAKAPA
jgi:thiopeptide-type bacteriocin biosynthesis protein